MPCDRQMAAFDQLQCTAVRTSRKSNLISQEINSFGHSVADTAVAMLKEKRSLISRSSAMKFHPVGQVTDSRPNIAKIKASGADPSITRQLGQGLCPLFDQGSGQLVSTSTGTPIMRWNRRPDRHQAAGNCRSRFVPGHGRHFNLDYARGAGKSLAAYSRAFQGCTDRPSRASSNAMGLLVKAIEEARLPGTRPTFIPKLEGMNIPPSPSGGRTAHAARMTISFFQPLYVSHIRTSRSQSDLRRGNTRLGMEKVGKLPPKDTVVPTTCDIETSPG